MCSLPKIDKLQKRNGGAEAPPSRKPEDDSDVSAEQTEDRLRGLRRERQSGRRELLAGLQGEEVGAFLVGVRERRLSAPVCSVLIIALVKSWRICTVDRLEPKA